MSISTALLVSTVIFLMSMRTSTWERYLPLSHPWFIPESILRRKKLQLGNFRERVWLSEDVLWLSCRQFLAKHQILLWRKLGMKTYCVLKYFCLLENSLSCFHCFKMLILCFRIARNSNVAENTSCMHHSWMQPWSAPLMLLWSLKLALVCILVLLAYHTPKKSLLSSISIWLIILSPLRKLWK